MNIGAIFVGNDNCRFRLWSPRTNNIEVKIYSQSPRVLQLEREGEYWTGTFDDVPPGTRYMYRINKGFERPDPASNIQPDDVHSPSAVVDHSSYKWNDENWISLQLRDYIIYELHIGTFTNEGTFDAAIEKIEHLKNLGITAVEIMPVSQFPGERNWGYDGVYPFAVQNSYGGPDGLKKFVDALHQNHIAVILDVVYNHLGPEGNYLSQFGPYFSSKYQTPWGKSVNFDDEYSGGVRHYFIQNAIYWFEHFHIDALRLDAIDKIIDLSAKHFLQELAEETEAYSGRTGKKKILIAESDLNDEKIIRPIREYGFGIDAQWSDDFHHALHSILTGEKNGYYMDYGSRDELKKSIQESFVYNGTYSAFRKRIHGNDISKRTLDQFVVCSQNHDQIGNRAFGERISTLISFEASKLAACFVLLTPNIPLMFMGQEIHDKSPFHYFISHSDPELIFAVQNGRREEFKHFEWEEEVPDPFAEDTFLNSKIKWDNSSEERDAMLALYKALISCRKSNPVFSENSRKSLNVKTPGEYNLLTISRFGTRGRIFAICNIHFEPITDLITVPEGSWKKIIDTSSYEYLGPGSSTEDLIIGREQNFTIKPYSFVLYESEI